MTLAPQRLPDWPVYMARELALSYASVAALTKAQRGGGSWLTPLVLSAKAHLTDQEGQSR
jgi:hypothetical protein